MGQLCKMAELQQLVGELGSDAYKLCARECANIVLEVLDSVPEYHRFQEVLGAFPVAAAFATLYTHRGLFITRFASFDMSTLPVCFQFLLVDKLQKMLVKNPNHSMAECMRKKIRIMTLEMMTL
jgi:hypothetical protein